MVLDAAVAVCGLAVIRPAVDIEVVSTVRSSGDVEWVVLTPDVLCSVDVKSMEVLSEVAVEIIVVSVVDV